MHSSTSSSERQIPGGRWLGIWLGAAAIAFCCVGTLESFWRRQGHVPEVIDDPALWSTWRSRVSENGRRTIVLAGASRIQVGVSTDVLRRAYPDFNVIQLAIEDRSGIAVLRDLAGDDGFRGTLILSMTAHWLRKDAWTDQQEYVDFYHRTFPLNTELNRMAATWMQTHLVSVDPFLSPKRVVEQWVEDRRLPGPRYARTFADRSRESDFTMTNAELQKQLGVQKIRDTFARHPSVPADSWLTDAQELEGLVQKISSRGGQVVFLRMPTAGEAWELEEQQYPRATYWDRFAAVTTAEMVHFRDMDGLDGLLLPDLTHLDKRSREQFTRALVAELVRRQILPEPITIDVSAMSDAVDVIPLRP